MNPVYEIIARTIDKHGQILIEPEIAVNTFSTYLLWTDDKIITSYHAHSESEQYHIEIRNVCLSF